MNPIQDPFFDVPKTVVTTSAGDVALPVCYFDGSHYMALFRVSPVKVAEKLVDIPIQPVLVARKAVAMLSFFKYRDTSLGPYHEVGLSVLVSPEEEPIQLDSFNALSASSCPKTLGSYILDLPVSTPIAKVAGCEIWRYPKFVTELPIELDVDLFRGKVLDPEGGFILELAGERGLVLPETLPGPALVTYSMRDGQRIRTRIETRAKYQISGGGSIRLAVGNSPHRMAKNLHDLELDGKSPKLWQVTDQFQSLLFQGEWF
ncbi:MAG: acetoacetate decarboxylase family protein [Pirellulales bacterium]|nr:acetoacetate decarboxylase family protein [Pirellulales bacterium]